MKKKTRDIKSQTTKSKYRKKKEISLENHLNNPFSKLDIRERLDKELSTQLPENDGPIYKLKESSTVLNKQTYSMQQFSQNYNSKPLTGDNKMNQSEFHSPSYHCIYCNVSFPTKIKLQAHCLTDEHQSIIISDEGRDWKYRPPPRGILASEYSLCSNYSEKGICRFSDQCIQAHKMEELAEWKERFEYRSMKLEKAKERELHGASYADKLLEKLNGIQSIDNALSEKIDGVTCSVSSDVNLCISQKPSNHTWTLTLHCPYQIHAIALLYDSHRNHFFLTNITMINSQKHIHKSFKLKDSQEWINTEVELSENINMEYKIEIYFETEIYGTFRQAIVVDFGNEPVFLKKFCVDIVPLDEFKELESARTTVITHSERWCQENTNIILFKPIEKTSDDLFNDKLLDMYSPPTNKNITLNQTSLEKHPTKNNYRTRMHDLLHYEEMAQFDLISHFNIKSYLHLSKSYLIMPYSVSVANYALAGELYAKLDLNSEVSEDFPQGRLILNNCNSVFVSKADYSDSPNSATERTAYEALIEAKTKKEIYIRLSTQTVQDLGLQADFEAPLDIQFQLNRLPFCEMHYALDHLSTFNFLFPNAISELSIPWSPSIQWNETPNIKLNLKQKEALVAITADIHLQLPPVLIIGPFGTGKTFTLGQAISKVLQQPNTNILICTHSNSAADIYIRDYLHPQYEAGLLSAMPLRIYYHRRRVATVHTTIHKYCLFETVNGEQRFRVPNIEHILNHRVIVTTINTSICITQLGIPKGHFTHILIDEAAQVMECSTLIPLILANNFTRIVLAGDYMQLSTEVFSPLCKDKNLNISLLERLYDLYQEDYPCKIMLVENYRSHPAIIKVLEVCERVVEICKSWPVKLWGQLNQESIGVVSPYLDQVMRIRAELRKKKLYKVSVERVLNVQGKEFRVVILSTVRTRHTCSGDDSSLDYGFLSNAKLLTTAITRAQCLVAVVGDPVSLCSLGKCRKLWEEFLRQCSEAGSLHGITWSSLRSQLHGIELRKIYGLNPLAQEFIPRYLLFSAVPHPMTLLPHVPPVQCFPYVRPINYSPNLIPTLPVTYPPNPPSFFPSSVPYRTPLPPSKTAEAQKANPIVHYNSLPYPSVAGFYSNRATLLPFPPSPGITAFPTFAVPNLLPTGTTSPSFQPSIVQHPALGSYVANALPYQPKVGVLPQVIPARAPPPGFNLGANPVGNGFLDQERIKASLQQQQMIHNTFNSAPSSSQNTPSPSPDKSIQFFNNVHFPKERISQSDNAGESDRLPFRNDPKVVSPSPTFTDENLQHSSDAFIGEQFVEDISKLLSDQSPIKHSPESTRNLSDDFLNQRFLKSVSGFDHPCSVYQSSSELEEKRSSSNSLSSLASISSRPFVTLQQVEKSLSSPSYLSRDIVQNGLGHTMLESSRLYAPPPPPSHHLPHLASNGMADSLKWNNLGNHSPHQDFSLHSLFRSSCPNNNSSSNIPLYLRKGTLALGPNSNSQGISDSTSNNLTPSSGWSAETLRNIDPHSRNPSEKGDLIVGPSFSQIEVQRNNSICPKYHQNPVGSDSKTYAGVLRSALDLNCE